MQTNKPVTVDGYLAAFPEGTQAVFEQIRAIVLKAAPKATQKISYGIPAFMLNDTFLVYVAAYKKHVSIYPAPVKHPDFKADFAAYKTSTGTIQFPLDEPLPLPLIRRIIKHMLQENKKRSQQKKKK